MAKAFEAGDLRVDEELHLTPLAAEEEEPELVKLRAALDHRIGEARLPDLLLEVDAQVRFRWIMLGREPRSDKELLMVYAMAESAVNQVINSRMCKLRQMRWTPLGAHFLAQVRCAVLNGDAAQKLKSYNASRAAQVDSEV